MESFFTRDPEKQIPMTQVLKPSSHDQASSSSQSSFLRRPEKVDTDSHQKINYTKRRKRRNRAEAISDGMKNGAFTVCAVTLLAIQCMMMPRLVSSQSCHSVSSPVDAEIIVPYDPTYTAAQGGSFSYKKINAIPALTLDCTNADGTSYVQTLSQADLRFVCSEDDTNWSDCSNFQFTLTSQNTGTGHDLSISGDSSGTVYMGQEDLVYSTFCHTLTYQLCSMDQKPEAGGNFWPALSDDSLYYTDGTNGRNVVFTSTNTLTITVYSDTVRIQTNYWMASTVCSTIDASNYSIENNFSGFSYVTASSNDQIEISASSITSSINYKGLTKTMYYTAGSPFTGDGQTISVISGDLSIVKCEYDAPTKLLVFEKSSETALRFPQNSGGTKSLSFASLPQTNGASSCATTPSITVTANSSSELAITEYSGVLALDTAQSFTIDSSHTITSISETALTLQGTIQVCGYDNVGDSVKIFDEDPIIYWFESSVPKVVSNMNVISQISSQSSLSECDPVTEITFKNQDGVTELSSLFDVDLVAKTITFNTINTTWTSIVIEYKTFLYVTSDSSSEKQVIADTKTQTVTFRQCTYEWSNVRFDPAVEVKLYYYTDSTSTYTQTSLEQYTFTTPTWDKCGGSQSEYTVVFTAYEENTTTQISWATYDQGTSTYTVTLQPGQVASSTVFEMTFSMNDNGETFKTFTQPVGVYICSYTGVATNSANLVNGDSNISLVVTTETVGTDPSPEQINHVAKTNESDAQCAIDGPVSFESAESFVSLSGDNNYLDFILTSAIPSDNYQYSLQWSTATFVVIKRSGTINLKNCFEENGADINIRKANQQHFEAQQNDCVDLRQTDTSSDSYMVYLEVHNNADCANVQQFKLKKWENNSDCGAITTTTVSEDDTNLTYDDVTRFVEVNMAGILAQSSTDTEREVQIEITASNAYGVSQNVIFKVSLHRCDQPNASNPILPTNSVYFLNGRQSTQSMVFTSNQDNSERCPHYSFQIDDQSYNSIAWLSLDETEEDSRKATGLTITYDATMVNGTYTGKRILRSQEETFYIIICQFSMPSPVVVTTNLIFNVPTTSTPNIGEIVFNDAIMEPTESQLTGTNLQCPAASSAIALDNSQEYNYWTDNSNGTHTVLFNIIDSDSSGTRTFTFTGQVVSESFNDTSEFDISICKVVEYDTFLFQTTSYPSRIYYEPEKKWIIDSNASDNDDRQMTIRSVALTNITPSVCNFSSTITATDSAQSSWITYSYPIVTFVVQASQTSQYETVFTLKLTFTNLAGTLQVWRNFVIRNCEYETFTLPSTDYLDNHFVLKDTTYVDSLTQANWPIPNVYCQDYYFGLTISTTYDVSTTTYYIGGNPEDLTSKPDWLINWTQTQTTSTNHFSYEIAPTNDSELKTYTVTLEIYNRDNKQFTSSSFKINLFKIEKTAPYFYFADVTDGFTVNASSDPPQFQMPLQKTLVDGSANNAQLIYPGTFNDMQNQPTIEVNLKMIIEINASSDDGTFLVSDNASIQSNLDTKFQVSSSLETMSGYTWPTIINTEIYNQLDLVDETAYYYSTPTYKADIEIVDCLAQITQPTTNIFTKVNSDSIFYTELGSSEDYTIVCNSEDGLEVSISQAATAKETNVCGQVYTSVDFSSATDVATLNLISFDVNTSKITLNSIIAEEGSLTVTVKAKNKYDGTKVMQTSKFEWLSCQDKLPQDNDGFTGIDTEQLFDYNDDSVTESTMTFADFTFLEHYCFVDVYQFSCTDPDGNTYVYDTLNGDTDSSSTKCAKFDLTGLKSSRTISADITTFVQQDEGQYTLTVSAWMHINTSLGIKSQTHSATSWIRSIQTNCLDTAEGAQLVIQDIVDLQNEIIEILIYHHSDSQELSDPQNQSRSYGSKVPFSLFMPYTCKFDMKIYDASDTEQSYMFIDEADLKIKVLANTLNSDFPIPTVDESSVSVATKQFYLHAAVVGSTKRQAPQLYSEIPFQVKFTLNCSVDKVTITPINQVADSDPIVIVMSPDYEYTQLFDKVDAVETENKNCLIHDSNGYILVQRGYNDTDLNTLYSGTDFFDSDLIDLVTSYGDDARKIQIIFKTHVLDYRNGETDKTLPNVKTYDPVTRTICDLSKISTKICMQEYEIYAQSYSGIIAKIATFNVQFRSECYTVKVQYDAMSPLEQKTNFWTWSEEDKNNFEKGFTLRQGLTHYNLPRWIPTLASLADPLAICGDISYTYTNPDPEIFSNFYPTTSSYETPTFDFETEEVGKISDYKNPPYAEIFQLTVTVSFDEYPEEGNFVYPIDTIENDLQFVLKDSCLGVSYEKTIQIKDYDEINKQWVDFPGRTIIYHVLQDPKIYQIQMHSYYLYPITGLSVPEQSEDCGYTLYEMDWIKDEESIPKVLKPDNEGLFSKVDKDLYNSKNGLDPLSMEIYSTTHDDMGSYTYRIQARASNINTSDVFFKLDINIEIRECLTAEVAATENLSSVTLYVNDTQFERDWQDFRQYPACNYTWQYQVFLIPEFAGEPDGLRLSDLQTAASTVKPKVLQYYDSGEQKLALGTSTLDWVEKQLQVYIYGELEYFESDGLISLTTYNAFNVQIDMPYYLLFNHKPEVSFADGIGTEINIKPGENKQIGFNRPVDLENNAVWLNFMESSLGEKFKWVTLNNATEVENIQILIQVPEDLEKEESFKIHFEFRDDHIIAPYSSYVELKVNVVLEIEEEIIEQSFFDINTLIEQEQKVRDEIVFTPTMQILPMDSTARIKIEFDFPIYYNSSAIQQELDGTPLRNLQDEIDDSQSDNYSQSFDELASLTDSNDGSKVFNIEYKPAEQSIKLQENEEDDIEVYWKIEVIDDRAFNIVVDFSRKDLISQLKTVDKLNVEVLNSEVFKGQSGTKVKVPELKKETNIPNIWPSKFANAGVEGSLSTAFEQAVKSFMSANAFLSLFLAGAMQYLFGMVNALQIITLTVYFDLLLPTNLAAIQVAINKTCNFDLFKTDEILAGMFGFDGDTDSFSEKFEESGLDGSNFIIGIGLIFFFLVYMPIFIIIHSSAMYICKGEQKIKCIKNFVKPRNHLIVFMIFLIESSVEIGLTGLVCVVLLNEDRVSSASEIFSTILCFFLLACLVMAPIYTLVAGYKLYRARQRKDKETIEKYGAIFEGKRFKSFLAIQYTTIFFLRRFLMLYVILFMNEDGLQQVNVTVYSTLFMVLYTHLVQPYDSPAMNMQEIQNEIFVLLCSYLLYCYTGWVADPEMRYVIGWSHIGFISFLLIFNITLIILQLRGQCKQDCKKKAYKKSVAKAKINFEKHLISLKQKEEDQKQGKIDQEKYMMNLFGLSSSDNNIEVVAKNSKNKYSKSMFDQEDNNGENKLNTIEEQSELDSSESSSSSISDQVLSISSESESHHQSSFSDKVLSISSESKQSDAWYGSDPIERPQAAAATTIESRPSNLLIETKPKKKKKKKATKTKRKNNFGQTQKINMSSTGLNLPSQAMFALQEAGKIQQSQSLNIVQNSQQLKAFENLAKIPKAEEFDKVVSKILQPDNIITFMDQQEDIQQLSDRSQPGRPVQDYIVPADDDGHSGSLLLLDHNNTTNDQKQTERENYVDQQIAQAMNPRKATDRSFGLPSFYEQTLIESHQKLSQASHQASFINQGFTNREFPDGRLIRNQIPTDRDYQNHRNELDQQQPHQTLSQQRSFNLPSAQRRNDNKLLFNGGRERLQQEYDPRGGVDNDRYGGVQGAVATFKRQAKKVDRRQIVEDTFEP